MCDEYCNNNKPLGSQEAENAWYEHKRKADSAMSSDIYTNGGLLDRYNAMGYEQPMFGGPSMMQQILEKEFSYEELKFIAGARLLMNMSVTDIDRLISLLEKLKSAIKNIPTNGLPSPVTPSWNNPYQGFNGGVQPLYGCPIPQDQRNLNAKWEKDLWTRKWGNLGEDTGFDFPKDKEEDDKNEEERMPSFLGAAWNDPAPVRSKVEKFYSPGTPFPEKIGEKKGSHKRTVILSAEGAPSKDDSSLSKVVIDGPSTGIAINDNPVSLTEENKSVSVDEENKD